MKKVLPFIVCLSAASVFGARQTFVPTLPESPFADTEASTNVAFRPCLCREGWNMVRPVRRGLGALSETLSASVSHKGLVVVVQ